MGAMIIYPRRPWRFGATPIPAVVYADLWQALVAWVDAMDPSFAGGFSAYRDPAGVVLPYAVYAKLPAERGYDSTGAIDAGAFTITCYAADLVSASAMAASLVGGTAPVLKDPPLVFIGGTLLFLRPSSVEDGDIDPDPGPNGEDVYSSLITCRYLIDRDT